MGGKRLFRSNPTWCRIVLRGSIKRRVDCPLITLDWVQGTVLDPGLCCPHWGLSFPNHLPEFVHTVKDGRSWGRAGLISIRGHVEVFQSSPPAGDMWKYTTTDADDDTMSTCPLSVVANDPTPTWRVKDFYQSLKPLRIFFLSYMGDWENPVMKKSIYCLIVSAFYLNLPICPEENQYDGYPVVTLPINISTKANV